MRLIDGDALIEQIEKNKCEPCKIRRHDRNGLRCRFCQYGDEMDDIYDAPTIETQKWIPCSERLPEEGKMYLVTYTTITGQKRVGTTRCTYAGETPRYIGWKKNINGKIIAYMPLPEPYKEG